jgi:DUF4097 and DUF4098 domain-containing protein YvlB
MTDMTRRCRRLAPRLALCWLTLAPAAPAAAQDAVPPPLPVAGVPMPERVAWFSRYQDSRSGPEATETITRTFKVGPSGSIEIFNLAGPIVVAGGPGDTIVVTAIKRARAGDDDEAKAQLAAIDVEAVETGGRVEVRTVVRGKVKQLRTWVDYSVTVPYDTSVSARALAGDVKVVKVNGDVQLESTSGSVEARGTPRLTRVKTLSGDVLIADAAAAGALLASTVSGRLVAKGVKAQSIELTTISGDLLLVNAATERAQVRTVSGTLEFAGTLARSGRYEFNSHAGDVRLKLGKTTGFELTAKTFSGEFRSDLALTMDESRGSGQGPHPGPRRRDVRGVFGDGSALIVVKTFSGSIVVGAEAPKPPAPPTPPKAPAPPKPHQE